MTDFQRARRPEQKEQRLHAILKAAGDLFETQAYDAVSMQKIANEAGLGKASLYHYFQTKEEVFMEIFLRDVVAWTDDFEIRMSRLRKPNVRRVAATLTELMVIHSRCSRLMSLLSGVLERNISIDKLRAFKLALLEPSARIRQQLATALPQLSPRRLDDFLLDFHVIVSGLWPVTHPTDDYLEAISVPELEHHRAEFEPRCKALIEKLLSE